MPQANILIVGGDPTVSQKQEIFARVTDLMVSVLGRTRSTVIVTVSVQPASDWSLGGESAPNPGFFGAQAVIRVVTGTGTTAQKSEMISECTSVLRSVLGEGKLPLYVTFEEVPPEHWGFNGQTVAAMRASAAGKKS